MPQGSAVGRSGGADGVLAVERHGQDAGDGGFADAAVAAEDVAVGDAALGERVEQRAGDVLLPDHVAEELRAVFAGENLVGHLSESMLGSTAIVVLRQVRKPGAPGFA